MSHTGTLSHPYTWLQRSYPPTTGEKHSENSNNKTTTKPNKNLHELVLWWIIVTPTLERREIGSITLPESRLSQLVLSSSTQTVWLHRVGWAISPILNRHLWRVWQMSCVLKDKIYHKSEKAEIISSEHKKHRGVWWEKQKVCSGREENSDYGMRKSWVKVRKGERIMEA